MKMPSFGDRKPERFWGRAAMKGHPQATENLAALANELTEDEKNQGRTEVGEWTQNKKVLQYFVVREGD